MRVPTSAALFAPRSKGISKSALPYRRTPPSWLKTSPTEVLDQVTKLAKKGLTPSQIGVILRDSHGIAQVSHVTGSKILRMLKKAGARPPRASRTPRTRRARRGTRSLTRWHRGARCAQASRPIFQRTSTA